MTQPTIRLETKNLSKTYQLGNETIHALESVTMQVHAGEFLAVMGPSGSGKSTLLHMLGLLDKPDAGEVIIAGVSTRDLNDDALTALRRDTLGFVFQSFELIPTLSARDNILLPADVSGNKKQALPLLELLSARLGIGDRLRHKPSQLSGGQRQRVALARALINDPAVILADEPTGNLDSHTGSEVLQLLREGVDEEGWTVMMVTHDPHAALMADRIMFLKDGVVHTTARTNQDDIETLIQQFIR